MRLSVLPPPPPDEFGGRLILELVRDFPELAQPLRDLGIDPGEVGEVRLEEALQERGAALAALNAVVEWRVPSAQ